MKVKIARRLLARAAFWSIRSRIRAPSRERVHMYTSRANIQCTRFLVGMANTGPGGGNENSMVRWAVPPPQMYSVGGLTRIYETRGAERRVRAHARCTHARTHALHVSRAHARAQLCPATDVTCALPVSTYLPPYPVRSLARSLARSHLPLPPPPSLPLPRAVIQSSASYDLYVVIPSV